MVILDISFVFTLYYIKKFELKLNYKDKKINYIFIILYTIKIRFLWK